MRGEDEGSSTAKENHEWKIPLPQSTSRRRQHYPQSCSSSSTPLLPIRQRLVRPRPAVAHPQPSRQPLFPSSPSRPTERNRLLLDAETSHESSHNNRSVFRPSFLEAATLDEKPTGLARFFFGFMYEEPFEDSFDYGDEDLIDGLENDPGSSKNRSVWNSLNLALFAAYTFTTAATTVPVLLVPTMAKELQPDDTSGFASRAVASAVMGTACGKFLNGPTGDVLGARRTGVLYSFLLALALLGMGLCTDASSIIWACFFVEFFQSVQWPCILIILATHYGPQQQHISGKGSSAAGHSMYESGIYMTSIASRLGSLLGIPFFSKFLNGQDGSSSQWRWVCFSGTWIAMIAASISYLFVVDSPRQVNEPQNPLHPALLRRLASDTPKMPRQLVGLGVSVLHSMLNENLVPSLRHVLKSGTFWIVALAHTGSSMIRTSERVLTTYFHDTSMGFLSQDKASGLSIFASLGTIMGLAICGTYFSSLPQERHRKHFVSRLYVLVIASCYVLAVFAIPRLYDAMDSPGLVLFFQIFASFCMNLGISVMFYQIPGLVGSAFGNHKGLFSAYVDGVSYGMASIVWKIVASSVSENSAGAGWAYGWAAVALLVILCAILMTEFLEHYFVRPSLRHGSGGGVYETIILA